MIELISNYFKPKESLGCDIGASSIKFARLKNSKEGLSLEALGIFEADILSGNEVAIQRAQAFLKENELIGSHASVNIEDKSLRIRRMDIPDMPAGDLKIAIKWNFREYVDGPIEKFVVNYSDLNRVSGDADKKPFLAFAVSIDSVNKIVALIKQVGLRPVAVEPNATAMLAAYNHNLGWEEGRFDVMIDFGKDLANFIVLGNSSLLFSRPILPAGYSNLVRIASKDLACTGEEAQNLLKQYLADQKAAGEEKAAIIAGSLAVFMGQIVVDIQRSIDAFCIMFGAEKVDNIYISGGGSLLPNIDEYISKNLGVKTFLFNPMARIDMGAMGGFVKNPQLYTVAIGLAIPMGK